VLQVTRDRGAGIVLVAAILILGGLLLSLYGSRRRVFVTAEPAGAGSVLRVGGFAVQRTDEFEREFAALVADLREPVAR
jgi:cytochrome c biogenesis protein ResB